MCPMWSTTIGTGSCRSRGATSTRSRQSRSSCRCQPSGARERASCSSASSVSPPLKSTLTRTPRKPAVCRRSSSCSLTLGSTTATPRHRPPASATESSVQRLSVPYTLGWTITACAIPSEESIWRYAARLASGGVKLRLGVKGYCSTGPKMCAWQSQASDGVEWIGVPGSGFGPWQNGIEFPSARSFIDPQLFSSGLRQHEYSKDHDQVGGHGERGDGVSQGDARAEVADERRKQRANAASEVIREYLAGAAQPAGKEFREERADRTERPRREEAERKSQHQHDRVADGQIGVRSHRQEGANRKEYQGPLATKAISQPRADHVADERAHNHNEEITAGVEHRQAARRLQECRQPCGDGVVTALNAGRQQRGEKGDLQHRWAEDFQEMAPLAEFDLARSCLAEHFGLGNIAPDVEDQQGWKNADPEHGAPRSFGGQYGEEHGKADCGDAPPDCPSTLHGADRFAAVLRANGFTHQH